MAMTKLESKRIVFLTLAIGYLVLTIIQMITKVEVPSSFTALVGYIIGHYFGFDDGGVRKE